MESNELKKKNIQTIREEIDYGSVNLRKVAVIGCGFVGSASAFALMQSGMFSEMVLIDADHDKAEGEALDISHGTPFARPMKIYAGGYDDIVDASIIVITAGANQKPGETRLDLVKKNIGILIRLPASVSSASATAAAPPVTIPRLPVPVRPTTTFISISTPFIFLSPPR